MAINGISKANHQKRIQLLSNYEEFYTHVSQLEMAYNEYSMLIQKLGKVVSCYEEIVADVKRVELLQIKQLRKESKMKLKIQTLEQR